MERFNITVPRKYTSNGEEKTQWSNVGKLIKFEATDEKSESFILELNMFPDTKFGVFKDEPKKTTGVDYNQNEEPVPF